MAIILHRAVSNSWVIIPEFFLASFHVLKRELKLMEEKTLILDDLNNHVIKPRKVIVKLVFFKGEKRVNVHSVKWLGLCLKAIITQILASNRLFG